MSYGNEHDISEHKCPAGRVVYAMDGDSSGITGYAHDDDNKPCNPADPGGCERRSYPWKNYRALQYSVQYYDGKNWVACRRGRCQVTERRKGERRGKETLRAVASALKANGMRCNCDLDNWEPESRTGHSWVCRIHKAAVDSAVRRSGKDRRTKPAELFLQTGPPDPRCPECGMADPPNGHAHVEPTTIPVRVNDRLCRIPSRRANGAVIKAAAGIPQDYELYKQVGNTAVAVTGEDEVLLAENDVFRAIPPAVFGAEPAYLRCTCDWIKAVNGPTRIAGGACNVHN